MKRFWFALSVFLFTSFALPALAATEPLTVYAAASLTNVLQDIAAAYTKETGVPVRFSFAASSTLARQIDAGAPADVFISADEDWMAYLQQRKKIETASQETIAGNRLVLIAPKDSTTLLKITSGFALKAALGKDGRLAIADPGSVPAGRYAKAALTSFGVWADVEQRILPMENVRAALLVVERGEAPLGIVYETDAMIDPGVKVVDVFPETSHPKIVYPAAIVMGAKTSAGQFLKYILSAKASALFQHYGFSGRR